MTDVELAARTQRRVDGRNLAALMIEMINDEAAHHPPEGVIALWEVLHAESLKHYTPPPPPAEQPQVTYMPDIKLRRFEATAVPYQQYKGQSVGNVMATADGREFLAWVAAQSFIDELRDYLANPTIARELS